MLRAEHKLFLLGGRSEFHGAVRAYRGGRRVVA